MTDTSKLREAFLHEYVATGNNLDAALAAVQTAMLAQLELPLGGPKEVEVRVVVEHRRARAKTERCESVLAKVKRLAAAEFGVDVRRLSVGSPGYSRERSHSYARWTALGVYRGMGLSLPACARAAGMSDHTSVIYALKRIAERPYLQAAVARVQRAIDAEAVPESTAKGARALSTLADEEAA